MTTKERRRGIAVMAEIVAVLARHSGVRVSPVVDLEDGVLALTVRVEADGADGLQVLALADELKYVADVAQVRHIARQYDIPAAALEALLPSHDRDGFMHAALTVPEIDEVVKVLTDGDVHSVDVELVNAALPKLVQLARAMGSAA